MIKDKVEGFITGVAITALLFSVTVTGFAATGSQSITATYNNIKVYVNEKLTTLSDANGNTIEPFIYNGTTYVPLRAVGSALGQEVSWDNSTKSIYIGSQPSPAATTQPITTSGNVIVEQDGIKITYQGIEKNSSYFGGYNIKLKIENSTSKNYTAQVRNFSLNGIMCDASLSCNIAAGKTAIDSIRIYDSALEKISQTSISEIDTSFFVFDSDSWDELFETSIVHIVV